MPITPHDLLRWAEAQADQPDEVTLRASASRAYYAAYHASLPFVAGMEMSPTLKGGVHDQTIEKLLRKPETKKIGFLLQGIKKNRTKADYKLEEDWDKAWTERTIQTSRIILQEAANTPQRNAP